MKISFRILLINFLIVALILGSSFVVFYSISYEVLTSFQTRNLRQSTNSFAYVYRSLLTEMEDNFFSIYNDDIDLPFKNQKLSTKNIDFVLEGNDTPDDNFSRYVVNHNIYLPERRFNLKEFLNYNPYVILLSFKDNNNRLFIYGRNLNPEILDELSQRINADVALVWNDNPVDFSNQLLNQKYYYILTRAVENLKNKSNFELFVEGTESKDILATIYKPVSDNKYDSNYFLVFSTFAEAGELRSTLKNVFWVIAFAGIVLSLIFTFVFTDKLRKQITELSIATEQTYSGDYRHKIDVKSKDEIGKLGMAFNKMLDELEKKEITKREYAEFITLINKNPTLKEVSDAALRKILDSGDFLIGGLYGIDDEVTLISSSGLSHSNIARIETSVFMEKAINSKEKLELFDENSLPVVSTGLIDIKIKYLLFLPILYNNKPVALLELGSLKKPSEEVQDYLDKIKDQLAIGITNAKALSQLESLVVKLKQLNEDYQKQNLQIKGQNETLVQLHNELKLQTDELEKQKQKALILTETKSKFLANMSHELRTPMNSILGLTELMLEKTYLDHHNKERLEVVLNSGKRLMNLINDLLDLSKIEAGKIEVQCEEVILSNLIEEVSNSISPLAEEKGIDYKIIRNVDLLKAVSVDRDKITQVLINLLGNAVKYTDKGEIVFKISVVEDMLRFEVTDTGIGISEEEIEVIFEEFRQLNGSKSKSRGGSGLGLAISKKLAEILGGSLEVESEINKGSTFTFTVPFRVAEESSDDPDNKVNIYSLVNNRFEMQEKTAIVDISENDSKKKEPVTINLPDNEVNDENNLSAEVLIVDDDPDTLFTLNEIVKSCSCKTILAKSGTECLKQLEQKTPDLILLDILMPEMDGFQTIRQIKKNSRWAEIPIYAVTAKAMKEDNEIILRHGFSDYIPKPVNPSVVSYKIQKLITRLKIV